MAHDPFLDRARASFPTSAGDVELPGLFRDGAAVFAFFRADLGRAAQVLAGGPFVPVRFAGGGALAALAAYDYRDSSIGPYREVGTALAVVPRGVRVPALPLLHLVREEAHDDVGWHVLDLPVTTRIADAAGRELFGLPKFESEIAFELGAGSARVVVQAPTGEEPVLALEGHPGPGVVLGSMDLVLYTELGGALHRSLVETRGRMHTSLGRGLVLRTGGADHPMARRLRALGLDGARPFAAQVCTRWQAVLNEPMPFAVASRKAA
jgi:hypothetical protein